MNSATVPATTPADAVETVVQPQKGGHLIESFRKKAQALLRREPAAKQPLCRACSCSAGSERRESAAGRRMFERAVVLANTLPAFGRVDVVRNGPSRASLLGIFFYVFGEFGGYSAG